MSDSTVSERIGTALGLVLDLDTALYVQLRVEFLAMTARAARDSGVKRAVLAKRVKAAGVAKSTVYNYAGDPNYKSFPQPKQLTVYLQACGFTSEQVVFAVARCELIRILYPEGERSCTPPSSWPVPLVGPLGIAVREYEQLMGEVDEQVRSLLADVAPTRTALRAIGGWELPFTGGQEQFVRELFARTDIPLAEEVDFAAPQRMSPLASVPVRPGDIIRTEHGYLGILTEGPQLIYLGPRGWPRSMLLGERVRVAAWRLKPVQRNRNLITTASRVAAHGGTPRPDKATGPRATRLTTLVGVCETLAVAHRCGVALPVSAGQVFDAAFRGDELDPATSVWAPTPRTPLRPPPAVRKRAATPPLIGRPAIPTAPASSTPPSPHPSSPEPPPPSSRPGRYPIMPPAELGEQGILAQVAHWYTAIGAQVSRGQRLARIENPLAGFDLDVYSPASGVLTEITTAQAEMVSPGQQLGIITTPPHRQ